MSGAEGIPGTKRAMKTAARAGRAWAAAGAMAASVIVARPAQAQSEPPLGRAQMAEDMRAYFRGEKWQGPVFFGAGVAAGGIGAALITRDDAIARGAAYPVFAVGLVQLLVGAVVFLRTDAQVARLDKQLAADPAAFKKDESARIRAVNKQFIALAIVETALLAGGAATAIVAAQSDCCRTLQGVGLGLAGQGAAMLMLDAFAAVRARDYADSLRRFEPAATAGARLPEPPAPIGVGPITFGFQF